MTRRPRILDLFSGAGGAAMGYHRAGFHVIGVDIADQPDYPFEFHRADALAFLADHGHEFDAIHASPPCQRYSRLRFYNDTAEKQQRYNAKFADLIDATRNVINMVGVTYVIENVELARAELISPVLLCGDMFGLRVYRHRLFESNRELSVPEHPRPYHQHLCTRNGYLPTRERPFMSIHGGKHSRAWQRKAAKVMGVEWITTIAATCEAIPPAYTEHLGRQLLRGVLNGT